ncbi:MAG: hypothetical protein Q7T58_05170 [Methylotenera sp.]|nr:hypothetical protein [Methylotenera sp.]
MEGLKKLDQLTKMDEMHQLTSQITGQLIELELLHKAVSSITLHEGVPEEIQGQFNVARNMALYQYFHYALAPEIQLKTYTIIEFALRLRANSTKRLMLSALVEMAVKKSWITDAGFRHIKNPQPDNLYCKQLKEVLPRLRNGAAHGSSNLTPESVGHLAICADLVNQLFSEKAQTTSLSLIC